MINRTVAIAAALALTAAAVALTGVVFGPWTSRAGDRPATMLMEELHRQVDYRTLPIQAPPDP